jgi:hypothetical protein
VLTTGSTDETRNPIFKTLVDLIQINPDWPVQDKVIEFCRLCHLTGDSKNCLNQQDKSDRL